MEKQNLTPKELRARLEGFSRVELIHSPTPFRKLERLSRELSGPEIFVKREDMTGLGFGGNKSRKLEYIIPDILAKKADVVITYASLQSNWCLQTAAAALMFGVIPLLLLFKTHDLPDELDGNLLLDHILGARIRIRDGGQASSSMSRSWKRPWKRPPTRSGNGDTLPMWLQ